MTTPRPHHGFLQDYSRAVYILKDHQGQEDRTQAYDAGICYLDYDALLDAAPETDHFEGSFAPHVTVPTYSMKDHRQAQCRTALSQRPVLLCQTPNQMIPSQGVLSATGQATAADGVSIVHRLATADQRIRLPKR